jgi:hypothetical protein
MKPVMQNGVDKNVDVTWSPRIDGHIFYHPIGMADPHDEAGEIALDTAAWVGDAMMQAAPYSRVISAAALTGGLTVGAATSVVLHGRDFDGKELKKEELPKFMQGTFGKLKEMGVVGKLDHNPALPDFASRSKRFTVRYAIPAVMGGGAVWAASRLYFDKLHTNKDAKNPKYLEDYSAAVASRQAKPWGVMSAVTSLFASASGASFLPFNYGVAVNTQSYMESGHRVMMPVIGKAFSNNQSTLSYGTGELEHFLARYTAQNPSIHPERLEQLWGALVKAHFPDVTKQQIQNLVDETHTLRDPYIKRMLDGEDAKKVRAEMETVFTKQFSKEGLWEMLSKAGIDPSSAVVTNNGLAGKLGDKLGAKHDVEKLQEAYVARVKSWQETHPMPKVSQKILPENEPVLEGKPATIISQAQHHSLQNTQSQSASVGF